MSDLFHDRLPLVKLFGGWVYESMVRGSIDGVITGGNGRIPNENELFQKRKLIEEIELAWFSSKNTKYTVVQCKTLDPRFSCGPRSAILDSFVVEIGEAADGLAPRIKSVEIHRIDLGIDVY